MLYYVELGCAGVALTQVITRATTRATLIRASATGARVVGRNSTGPKTTEIACKQGQVPLDTQVQARSLFWPQARF